MGNSLDNPFSLTGKTILITGASSGIGRATAIECSRMGASVVLSARNQERLKETLSMMEGENHIIITADLNNEEEIHELSNNVPSLNGVVNVAGILCLKPLKFYSSTYVENTFSINTFSGMYLIKNLLKMNKIHKDASLVFLSSIAASLVPSYSNGIYSASKAAIDAYSRQCALELSKMGIRSNSISPGLIKTELILNNPMYTTEDIKNAGKISLLNRLGKPEEIAWAIIFLLSDASKYITGSSIIIDGGAHMKY